MTVLTSSVKERQLLFFLPFQTVLKEDKCKARYIGETDSAVLKVVVHEPVSWGMWTDTSILPLGIVPASTETCTTTYGVIHL